MFSLHQIGKFYPPDEQEFKRNILREYLQYKILEIIFNSKIGQKLSFLGGTCLRIVYGNTRFSEDLDFDNFGLSEKEFESLIDEVQHGLELQGYQVEIKNVYKGAYRSYIRMPRVLFENEVSIFEEEKILIQVDTVPHAFDYEKDIKILNKFDIFTQIFSTPLDLLLSQKIYAAMNRPRPKGRDFFDIVFLLPQTKPNYEYLAQKLGISNGHDLKKIFISKVSEFNFEELARDVEPFLIQSNNSKKVKLFLPYIQGFDFE